MIFDPHGMIKKVQTNLICPVCGRHFSKSEIQIKQIIENNVIFHAQCNHGHPAVQSIHIAVINSAKNSIKRASKTKNLNLLNKQIDEFDGDFIKLWKK